MRLASSPHDLTATFDADPDCRRRAAGDSQASRAYTSHQSLVTLDEIRQRYPIGAIVFEAGVNDGTWAPVRSDRELAMLSRPPGFGSALQRSNSR